MARQELETAHELVLEHKRIRQGMPVVREWEDTLLQQLLQEREEARTTYAETQSALAPYKTYIRLRKKRVYDRINHYHKQAKEL